MRSKLLVCAAIASIGVSNWFGSVSHAADPKDANSSKRKPSELHADDKSMKRQTQWEDKVMGPDSKRAELEKIARARAINEKAEKDKETRDKQASLETAAPAPAASRKNEKTEVSLLSPEKNDTSRSREISPKLATEAAQAPVAPSKPADDKFIDKLLKEEDAPSKKHASASDRELENLLTGAGSSKDKPAGRKHGDSVDDLLKSADKGPAMPAPRAQSGLPDWAKQPEIASSTPAPAPLALRTSTSTRKNDNSGVIQVVQGAAGNGPAVVSPARPAPVAARAGRKAGVTKAPAPVAWSDPFADKRPVAQAPKKEVASRPSPAVDGAWSDPFAEPSEGHKTVRHTTPASAPSSAPSSAPKRNEKTAAPSRGNDGNGGWKDPFTTKVTSAPARTSVAMREPARGESSKWEIAGRRPAARASAPDRAGAWGIIKKRAR